MSKKRKTRKEKELSQLKRQLNLTQKSSEAQNLQETKEIRISQIISTKINTSKINVSRDYSYVFTDVKHTLYITFAILFMNAIIFALIQRNIIRLTF